MLTSHAYGQRWMDMYRELAAATGARTKQLPTTARTTSTSSTRTSSQPRHMPLLATEPPSYPKLNGGTLITAAGWLSPAQPSAADRARVVVRICR
jgi:hypothetical protein